MSLTYLDLPEGRVTYEEVFACSDEGQLRAWHRATYDVSDDVTSQLVSAVEFDTSSSVWRRRAAGKVAICAQFMRWVERRMAELECEPPVTRKRHVAAYIARLEAEIADLKGGI